MSSLKIFLILFMLSNILMINAYYNPEMIINSDTPEKNISFNINKASNYSYNISFIHFGNIKNYTTVEIYLNNHLIYIISKSNNNTGSGIYKKSISIDITDNLTNGMNILKIVGKNMDAINYTPYYELENIYINEPIKTPIPIAGIIITIVMLCFFIIYRKDIKVR